MIIAYLRSTRAQFSKIHIMDGQEIEHKILISSQASLDERVKRNKKAKKHQEMTFNQVLCLENIESIAGRRLVIQ